MPFARDARYHRMSLLRDVAEALGGEGAPHALIGAAALAVHGVPRSTADCVLAAPLV
jgi:hypothetical protein